MTLRPLYLNMNLAGHLVFGYGIAVDREVNACMIYGIFCILIGGLGYMMTGGRDG